MQPPKKRILLFSDWFDPAYKGGGPIRSAVNFAKQMKDEYDIFVLTGDRDLGETKPMNGIVTDQWVDYIPGVKVFYASMQNLRLASIKEHANTIRPDFIYLNSMFSKKFTIYPLWLKRANRISAKVILAPRGMLKSSALDYKKRKKKAFLSILKWMKIPQLVTFHATDEQEHADIVSQFGKEVSVKTVSNFPGAQDQLSLPQIKVPGTLDILFIGRIHPIKGLDILLRALKPLKQTIVLDIVGNPEDLQYRNLCRKLILGLPKNIRVNFAHDIPHNRINQLISDHHIFCLPTKGENFGHAIFESLAAGRPVLISDQTPWRNLARYKAGWDLPLEDPSKFSEMIERFALMDSQEFNEWCRGAWDFCNNYIRGTNIKQQYLKLFS